MQRLEVLHACSHGYGYRCCHRAENAHDMCLQMLKEPNSRIVSLIFSHLIVVVAVVVPVVGLVVVVVVEGGYS